MKKVNCTCIYVKVEDGYKIKSINVKHKYNNIQLFRNNDITFKTTYDMGNVVLNVLKKNDFYVHTWNEFDSTLYDIDFIEINTGDIDRFYL